MSRTINELNTTDTLADGDKFVIWQDTSQATRAITAVDMAEYFGAEPGGPFQPLDELLTAVAALGPSTANGDFIQLTGQDTVRVRKLTVATYAALTNIASAFRFDDMLVYVSSRATDGDGGEGWWRFDAASSATANGYDVLAPDAGTGRWLSNAIYNKLARTKAAIKALDPTVVKSATLASDNPLENGTYFWRTGNFTALVAADTYGAYYLKADSVAASAGAYVLEHQANVYDLNRFGADPTGTTDSLAAYNIAAALVTASGTLGQIEFSGSYRNSAELVVTSNIIITAKARSSVSPIGAGTNGFRFQDGPGVYMGTQHLPALFSYPGVAINLDGGSLANIYCPQILAGGGIAVQFAALSNRNCLDNTVRVDVVGQKDEWCRVVTSDNEIIQGNVLTSNFVTSVARGVVFTTSGGVQPNWDSNRFEMEAWDPTPAIASSALLYARNTPNTIDVARTILKVHSWCGGLGATSKIVDADYLNGFDLYIAPAETFPAGYYDLSNGINNTTNVRNYASRVNTVFAAALTNVGKAAWNGGVPMTRNIENFSVTLAADLPDGNAIFAYVYHNLSDTYSNVVSVSQSYGASNGLVCESIEGRGWTGAGSDKEILMEFKNRSGATLTTGTVCQFKIKVGLP